MAQKTFVDGDVLTASDINTYLSGEGGAWTSFTPTVTQSGSVTVTNTRSRYARWGRRIEFTIDLAVTGSGTTGNAITVSLPVTAASANQVVGSGFVFDNGSGNLPCIAFASTTSVLAFLPTWVNTATGFLGTATGGGSFALASGDEITVWGSYEAAS